MQEIRDTIYNKKAKELNKDEVDFINQLINKKLTGMNFWYVSIFGTLAGLLIPSLLSSSLLVGLQDVLPVTMGVGGFLGFSLGTMFYMTAPTLKNLGLTRKDWKELKKSGRLKELKQIVKEYNSSLKADLDDLYEREEEITAEIHEKETEKQALIEEFIALQETKHQKYQSTEKTSHYTQEQVEEMLKAEESLLLKCLERNKQTQAMINKETDEKTLNEVGKSIQSKDYLVQALDNCKEFNEELDRETFDN